jgi:hypothetical protein
MGRRFAWRRSATRAILLIGAASWSMDWWETELCRRLADRSRLVVRAGDWSRRGPCRHPLAECERRNHKGLYARAGRGEISSIAGLDSPYPPPPHPEVEVDLCGMTSNATTEAVLAALSGHGIYWRDLTRPLPGGYD